MPVRHVLKVNGYGGRQAKGNEKRQCFKGWETLVMFLLWWFRLSKAYTFFSISK